MTQSPPPAKRARLSDDAPTASLPPSTGFKHHDEFWFDDGNLILVAKQNTAFRIYRGLFTAQSIFLADKVASACANPGQMFDRCPVVEVSDTPQELAHFLRVMLPKSKQLFYRRKNDPPFTFDQVAAVIRLSHKYKVEDVLMQAIGLLQERHFSADYIAWQERTVRPNILSHGHIAIGVVNLSRLTGVTSLLPIAIYECVRLGSAVLDGWRRDDGVIEYLSPQDLKLCLGARDALDREAVAIFLRVFDVTLSAECLDPELCPIHLHDAKQDTFTQYFPGHLVLDLWNPDLESHLKIYYICDECRDALLMRERQERHNLWGRLPDLLEKMSLAISPPTPSVKRSVTVADAATSGMHQNQCLASDPTTSSARSLCGPLANIKRHPEFWLNDGNLILVANRDTAFRIYTGLLASQSEIFANMFAVASSSADETYEGCPVVPVYDTPVEFAHFLRVLIPRESRSFHRTPRAAPFTFDQVAAVVRLTQKYDLPDIRDQALELLEEHAFPTHAPRAPETHPHPTLVVKDNNAIGAVNIARLVDKPSLLLPALHRCVTLGSAVLDGWTRDDGYVEHLSLVDLKLCMDAHPALLSERVTLFSESTYDHDPAHDCVASPQCEVGLQAVEDVMLREEFRQHRATLDEWETHITERADDCGVCGYCQKMLKDRDADLRREAWTRLPAIFGIEVAGWSEH
ncbi:hypothetical protein LXA43DRAFT_38544 [Ganoderma leucocontextum]|nr:hypothetical protein LXA43DRAFT_38544 [Ganoderma leucocontextum]